MRFARSKNFVVYSILIVLLPQVAFSSLAQASMTNEQLRKYGLEGQASAQSAKEAFINSYDSNMANNFDEGTFSYTTKDADGKEVKQSIQLFNPETDGKSISNLFGAKGQDGVKNIGAEAFSEQSAIANSELNVVKNSIVSIQNMPNGTTMRNDPIFAKTKSTFKQIKENEMFSSCVTDVSFDVKKTGEYNLKNLKTCIEDRRPTGCKLKRVVDRVETVSSCEPGQVGKTILSGLGHDWAKDGGTWYSLKEACSGSSYAALRWSVTGGECAPDKSGTVTFPLSGTGVVGSFSVNICQKYYSGLDKKKDRRTVTFTFSDPVCDDWRCEVNVRSSGHRRAGVNKKIYFTKQHAVHNVIDRVVDEPAGCFFDIKRCQPKPDENYIAGTDPTSNEIWRCDNYTNNGSYSTSIGSTAYLDPNDIMNDGILHSPPEYNSSILPLFEGDDPTLVCYEATARNYQCEADVPDGIEYCDENGENCTSLNFDPNEKERLSCKSLIDNPLCGETSSEVLSEDEGGFPLLVGREFACYDEGSFGAVSSTEKLSCNGPIKCMGEECINLNRDASSGEDFNAAMTSTAIIRSMKSDSKDCAFMMERINDSDMSSNYDVHVVFDSTKCYGCEQPINEVLALREEGFSVKGYSLDGAGIPNTDFDVLFEDGFPDFMTDEEKASINSYPTVFVSLINEGSESDFNQFHAEVAGGDAGFISSENVKNTINILHDTTRANFKDECGQNVKVFKGKKLECKITTIGYQVDCCSPDAMGLPSVDWVKALQAYELGAKLNEKFKLTQMVSEAAQEYAPGLYESVANMSNYLSEMWSSTTDEIAAMFTKEATEKAAEETGKQVAESVAAKGSGSIIDGMLKEVHTQVNEIFGENIGKEIITEEGGKYAMGNTLGTVVSIYGYYQMFTMAMDMIFACDQKDMEAAMKRQQYVCTDPVKYTSEKIGVPIQQKKASCCYSSPIVRVIQEEIRRIAGISQSQGGKNLYGIPTSFEPRKRKISSDLFGFHVRYAMDMHCDGFTPKQLTGINWSLFDGSKIVAILVKTGQIIDPAKATDEDILSYISQFSEFNLTNKVSMTSEMVEAENEQRRSQRESLEGQKQRFDSDIQRINSYIEIEEAEKTDLESRFNALTAQKKTSAEGLEILEKIKEKEDSIATYEIEIKKLEELILNVEEQLKNPDIQPIDSKPPIRLERDVLGLQFGGTDVTETLDEDRADAWLEAVNKAKN